ncbi:MAG: VanW family protein [Ardenticatenales bacterium]|nr:VanW family protein [Ardenticatenales bacterium]
MPDAPTSHRPHRTVDPDAVAAGRRAAVRTVAIAAASAVAGIVLIAAAVLRPPGGRIAPGVTAGGVALGGLSPDEAADRLVAVAPTGDVSVTLTDADTGRTWQRPAAEVGLRADPSSLAERAYAVGRTGGWPDRVRDVWRARFGPGIDIPLGTFDPDVARAALEGLADDFVVAPQAADLRIGPDGQLEEQTFVTGRTLDVDASLGALAEAARTGARVIPLVAGQTMPRVFDLKPVTDAYKLIMSAPVILRWRGGQSWTVSTAELAKWARVEDRPNEAGDPVPTIVLDNAAVTEWLAPIAAVVASPSEPARFGVEANRVILRQPAKLGYALDVPGTIERLIEAAYSDGRTNEVAVTEHPSDSQDGALAALELAAPRVNAATSLTGMPDGMRTNVRVAAAKLDGLAIEPGATFSMLEHLGAVSAESGYQMLFIDPLGAAADGLGGGVNHAATTLFRLAVLAGLPIVERHAHPVRIGWLEPPVGLDATVGPPERDLRFANDTGDTVMVLARIDPVRDALLMTLYSAGERRQVVLGAPDVRDVTAAAPPVERGAVGLPAGTRAQIGWAREGAVVRIQRIVQGPGGERRDTFESRYAPAADVFVVARN